MFYSKRTAVAAIGLICAHIAYAAPALTTIQDTLYRADGTRFEGTLTITWSSFDTGDGSHLPAQGLTVNVVNGALRVQLAPTTSSPGAQYKVRYNSQGRYQFDETWAVPPSSAALRVRDVRTSAGTIVGTAPPPISTIGISDIIGLEDELSVRPSKTARFLPSRAAVIDSMGGLAAAIGDPGDCVRVDGSAGPCGTGSSTVGAGSAPQIICSGIGSKTSSTTTQTLATCSVAAGLLQAGDRVEIRFDYSHEGGATPFSTQVQWGASAVLSRGGSGEDRMLTGRIDAAIHLDGTQWSALSWGSASQLGMGAAAGAAPDDYAAGFTIRFVGQMNASTTDIVNLRNFTVIRYPAQAN